MQSLKAEIITNERIGDKLYKLEFFSPYICRNAAPGQFINMRCCDPGQLDPLLRRPFSIYDTDKGFNVATILYIVRGKGTAFMARLERGDVIDLCGPLGKPLKVKADRILCISGGIGIAPLHFFAKSLASQEKKVYLLAGFKDPGYMQVEKDIRRLNLDYMIFCEEEMWANQGIVTDGLKDLKRFSAYQAYCCGPHEMLKDLQKKFSGSGIKAYALVEERMACGIGVCEGCIVKIKNRQGGFDYRKVCSDGPAFDLMELAFE